MYNLDLKDLTYMMSSRFGHLGYMECCKCKKTFFSKDLSIFCDTCKKKQDLVRILGWGSVAGVSLWNPALGSFAAGLMNSLENSFLGNPYQEKIYDLHKQLIAINHEKSFSDFEQLILKKRINRLEELNKQLFKKIEQQSLMRDIYLTNGFPWRKIAVYPNDFGVIRLERVNLSTRLEYLEYPLFIDIFLPDPEGKGLLHGGIPIEVVNPMISNSKPRKPMLYSYSNEKLSQPKDCI